MKYKHNWEVVPPTGMYDDLYRCTICQAENMESIDNGDSKNPEFGCVPLKEQNQNRLIPLVPDEGYIDLPNGCTLYWEINKAGGRTYHTDEVGILVNVWDTAITDNSTLLAAMTQEATLQRAERHWEERKAKNRDK